MAQNLASEIIFILVFAQFLSAFFKMAGAAEKLALENLFHATIDALKAIHKTELFLKAFLVVNFESLCASTRNTFTA